MLALLHRVLQGLQQRDQALLASSTLLYGTLHRFNHALREQLRVVLEDRAVGAHLERLCFLNLPLQLLQQNEMMPLPQLGRLLQRGPEAVALPQKKAVYFGDRSLHVA